MSIALQHVDGIHYTAPVRLCHSVWSAWQFHSDSVWIARPPSAESLRYVLHCLSSVGMTCPLHKIHCTPGLAKRSGSQQIWSLRWLLEEGWGGRAIHTFLILPPGGWSSVLCWGLWLGSGMRIGRCSGGRRR